MTTPEPRVRVRRYDAPNWPYHWQWVCELCLDSHDLYESHADALAGAAIHRCPAMRFRALLRELEALRDKERRAHDRALENAEGNRADRVCNAYLTGLAHAHSFDAADLAAIIDRVSRPDAATPRPETAQKLTALIDRAGGTGC